MDKRGSYVLLPLVMIVATIVWFSVRAEQVVGTDRAPTPRMTATATQTSTRHTALIVGDGYTAGEGGVSAAQTYAPQVCAALDWTCRIDAESGTGYVSTGHDGAAGDLSYSARLVGNAAHDASGADAPDVVVVTGGRADLGRKVASAAAGYFTHLREAYPKAMLVVVLPFRTDTDPAEKMQILTQDVESAALAAGVTVVPSDGLLTSADIGPDGVDPTVAGQRQLARRLTPRLAAATAQ